MQSKIESVAVQKINIALTNFRKEKALQEEENKSRTKKTHLLSS